MLGLLKEYIVSNNVFKINKDRLIATVSGGVDSVVMLDLFHRLGVHGAVAHCNFKLRDDESDQDETFVGKLAEKYNLPFYSKEFKTEDYANEQGVSVQMAARDLRYQWFEELRELLGYNYIALAQHRDDRIETFFINLVRGTGVGGLDALWLKRNTLIRPLLCFGRKEIETYALQNKLKFREDASNLSNKYIRNKIRHQIIPVLKEINPDFDARMGKNLDNFRFAADIVGDYFSQVKKEILIVQNGKYMIELENIKKFHPLNKYLFELLNEFGFSPQVCEDIATAVLSDAQSGKRFYSESYMLVIDRKHLLIQKMKMQEIKSFKIKEVDKKLRIEYHVEFTFEILKNDLDFKLIANTQIAMLDKSKLRFPLIIRKWRKGDWFYPLGMKGKKKISDYLIDNKFSLLEKNEILVVLSGDDIVWLVGQRIDNRYKITEKTSEIFVIYSQSLCTDNL